MRRLILALTLAAAACGTQGSAPTDDGSSLADTSTTTSTAVASSSTTSSTTATEALPCVASLDDGRPTILEPDCRYTHRAGEGPSPSTST